MRQTLRIENIERMRREKGIFDTQLMEDIRCLQIGHHVNVTFLCNHGRTGNKTVRVRICRIEELVMHGSLVETLSPATLKVGSLVTFKACHIHSIPVAQPKPFRRSSRGMPGDSRE